MPLLARIKSFLPQRSQAGKVDEPRPRTPFEWSRKVYEFLQYWKGFTLQKLGTFTAYLKGITKQVWIAWKCADLIASVLLSVEVKVQKASARGEYVDLPNSPLAKLLRRPNKWETWEEFIYKWTFHMLGTGNAYWLKDELNLLGQPTALFALNPKNVVIHTDPQSKVARYEYRVNGRSIYYGPEEIIHFQRPNPDDEQIGLGEMEAAQKLINEFIARDDLTANFMENGGAPAGVLVNEDPNAADNPADWKKKKAEWESKYWGKKAVGKPSWLAGKWSWLKIGISSAEFNDIERGKYTTERIMQVFGVPKSLIEGGSANYATARVEERNFRKYKCAPMIVLLVSRLNVDLCPAFGEGIRVDYLLGGLEDIEQILKDYGPAFDRACVSRNELRQMMGLPKVPRPEFDEFYFKKDYVPAELVGLTLPSSAEVNAANDQLRTDNAV